MVDDDQIDVLPGQPSRFLVGRGAAVQCDDQRRFFGREDAVEPLAAEAVSLRLPQRQEVACLEAVGREETVHDGEGSYAVHIVVPVEHNLFARSHSLRQALRGAFHAGGGQRIGQAGQPRVEKVFRLPRIGHGTRGQQGGEERGQAEFTGESFGDGGIRGIPRLPARRRHEAKVRVWGARKQCAGLRACVVGG